MIRLYSNKAEYTADIADELRLFLAKEEITISGSKACADIAVTIQNGKDDGLKRTAYANINIPKGKAEYVWQCDIPGDADMLEVKRREKRAVKIAVFRAMAKVYGFMPPWGSLTGIRPTRLLRELYIRHGEEEALSMMRQDFDVSEEKLRLAMEINSVQQPILDTQTELDADVYIGIPFCASRCLYCSFASQVRTKKTDMAAYLAALKRDITAGSAILKKANRRIRALYIGGGTPTVLTADELDSLICHALEAYSGFSGEFTVEAGRPDTITKAKLEVLKRRGVNRLSVNPQTMNMATLELIGRSHTPQDIIAAFGMARDMGFDRINMDVIAGLPGEHAADMEHTLNEIVKLSPENLTVHTLALKRSSRLVTEGERYPMTTAEEVERMVAMGAEAAKAMNMRPYYMYRQKYMSGNLENVGYAKENCECIYNIDMMEDTTAIMSHGAGAMTKCVYDAARRVERVPAPKEISVYINKIDRLSEDKAKLFLQQA